METGRKGSTGNTVSVSQGLKWSGRKGQQIRLQLSPHHLCTCQFYSVMKEKCF